MGVINTVSFSLADYDSEVSNFSMNIGDVTPLTLAGVYNAMATMKAAIEGVTLGSVRRQTLNVTDEFVVTSPSDKNAQRETKWLVVYYDDTQYYDPPTNAFRNPGYRKLFKCELPTADLSLLSNNPNGEADAAGAEYLAFKAAFESLGKSPYGGAVKLVKLVHVGRNL